MLTLYVMGPKFGLPDASPFVSKALVLLKMSGLPFATAKADFRKAPKGKIPYLRDGDLQLGDSTFMRGHLEDKHRIDFDKGLSASDTGVAWAFEKLCEDHLYWALVDSRWTDQANFDRGPRTYFDDVPAPLRPFVVGMVRRSIRKSLHGHGMGRHSRSEIEQLAKRDLDAIAAFLGSKPWLMGPEPCGADAAVWSMVSGVLCAHFETPIRTAAETHPNLVAYRDRGMARWFPELRHV
jgi:glutathione S-transferase